MSESKRNKREWVKTAAIIFLSIMLVLTFFSNTIMNHSLPEVATQYVQPDTITAKIRGNGIIESGDPYSVKIKGIRKVESVEVRVGDKVQKGDVLCYLSEEDSEELTLAKNNLTAAKKAYDDLLAQIEDVSVIQSNSELSSEEYKAKVIALKNEIALAEADVEAAREKLAELEAWGNALRTQISVTPSNNANTDAEEKAVANAQEAVSNAELAIQAAINEQARSRNEQTKLQNELDKYMLSVSGGDADLAYVTSLEQAIAAEKEKEAAAIQKHADEEVKKADAEYALAVAQKALNDKLASGDTSATLKNLEAQLDQNTLDIFHATNDLTAKESVLTEKNKALEEYVQKASSSFDLTAALETIRLAEEEVARLEAEVVGNEVVAPISGTIITSNVKSGLDTPDDGIVFTMQPEGAEFTMSFSVTNEQAKKLSVGDIAEPVNSWRYENMLIVLESIRPDRNNPADNKLLVFNITGDNVVANQSLNVSVGQKSATYDMVVPNSAIREDNNGKFILIVESKSSPIGTRYIATRVDVQVLASDDTKSAIQGALYGYEYVITTSTKPIEAGQQVRLSEN